MQCNNKFLELRMDHNVEIAPSVGGWLEGDSALKLAKSENDSSSGRPDSGVVIPRVVAADACR